MSSLALTLALVAIPDPSAYAGLVGEALTSSKAGLTTPGASVIEVGIAADGRVVVLRLPGAGNQRALDEQAAAWVLGADPLPPPPAELQDSTHATSCIVRVAMDAKKKKEAHAACFAPGTTLGRGPVAPEAKDAGALLLAGFAKEAVGDAAAAVALYKQAVAAAPSFDLANRALGLALVQQKKAAVAIPYLRLYSDARLGAPDAFAYRREIERFEKEQAARAAEFTRVRPRLGKEDVAMGLKKGYPLFEPCLVKARDKGLLALGTETLVLSWKVKKDGGVDTPRLEAPDKLLMTDHAECLERAMGRFRFPPYSEGSEIAVKSVPIKVKGGAPKPIAVASVAPGVPAAAAKEEEEPMFASCERPPDEVAGYIRERAVALKACVEAEIKRNPKAGLPEALPIVFVVDSAGPLRGIGINHRFFRDGELPRCVETALTGTLPPSSGADCPGEFSIDLRSAR